MTKRPPHKRRNEEEARDPKSRASNNRLHLLRGNSKAWRGSGAPFRLLPRVRLGALLVVPVTSLPIVLRRILSRMGTKSRETIYGASVRAAEDRATEARKEADRLAVEAWNKRMLGFQGPAQPSPTLGDVINAGFGYLEVKCLGCNTHQTVALDIVRR